MLTTPQEKINKLVQYHVAEEHLPTGWSDFKKETLLVILGLGGLNYVPIAYQNGGSLAIKIINAVTTAVSGEIVLYTSGEIYNKIKLEPQYVPSNLEGIIRAPLTKNEFLLEVSFQFILATASAVPLATTLFDADLEIFKQYPQLFWSAFAFILAVNTAMHLVPIELTLRDDFYGFIPHQLARAWRLIRDYQPSEKERKRMLSLNLRTRILNEINPILSNAKEEFLNILTTETSDQIQVRLQCYKAKPEKLLEDMLACYVPMPPLNRDAKMAARVLGGFIVSMACLGYAANPYLIFKNEFGFSKEVAMAMTAMPIYFFMVLMAFFGDGMGVRFLQDMLALNDIIANQATMHKKAPTVAKLYPIVFSIIVSSILFSVVFAGAPAREMMKMAFENSFPAWLMVVMMGIADIGIGILAWYAPLDFTKIMLSHYAQHYGSEPVKSVAIIKAKIEALLRDFNRINPELAEELNKYVLSLKPSIDEENSIVERRSYNCCLSFYGETQVKDECDSLKESLLRRPPINF